MSGLTASNHKEVKIIFVVPENKKPEQCSDTMKLTFQDCLERNLTAMWLNELECDTTAPKDYIPCYVLGEFKGKLFETLRGLKGSILVVGPICLKFCLMESLPIPVNNSPVFTMAMRHLHVTCSQLHEKERKDLKNLVRLMGGHFSNHFNDKCTHVVTSSVRSEKCVKALELGVNVMTKDWVNAVWEASVSENVLATDEIFEKYKCPVFYGLEITISNLPRTEKLKMSKLIQDNGGTYNPQLSQATASLLVVDKPEGEKFKHALTWNLPCVKPDWIYDCIKKKRTIKTTKYLLFANAKSSTPTKSTANFTHASDPTMSGIGFTENLITIQNIDETEHRNETCSIPSQAPSMTPKTPSKTSDMGNTHTPVKTPNKTPVKTPIKNAYNYKTVMSQLNLQDAKRAAGFLDGCKVFLSGFNPNEEDILRRILNAGGATRYANLSDVVTHVVVGELIPEDAETIVSLKTKPHVVTLDWIKDSIHQHHPANEDKYLCSKISQAFAPLEAASPLAQRGLKMLQPEFRKPLPNQDIQSSPMSKKILRDYSNSTAGPFDKELDFLEQRAEKVRAEIQTEPVNIPDTQDEDETTISNLFQGLCFMCSNLDSEIEEEVKNDITLAGGKIVSSRFSGVPDYTVVPILTDDLHTTSCEVVTFLWIKDCLDKCKILDIEFYHQPKIVERLSKPLTDCVLTSSNYVGQVRNFIRELGEGLGAQVQEVFAKKNKGQAAASTHLICPTPDGHKYKASLKWKVPAVSIDWIINCAEAGKKLPVEPYLVKQSEDTTNETSVSSKKETSPKRPSAAVQPLEVEKSAHSAVQIEDLASRISGASSSCETRSKVNISGGSERIKSRPLAEFNDQNSLQSLGNFNSSDFNTPLANSTINPAHLKRKSDSPLENNDSESAQQCGKVATPKPRKRWKDFNEFDEGKNVEQKQQKSSKKLSVSTSELPKKGCLNYETSLLPTAESSEQDIAAPDPQNESNQSTSRADNSCAALRKVLENHFQNIEAKLPSINASEGSYQRRFPRGPVIVRKLPKDSQPSQGREVEWDDPVEALQRERDLLQQHSDKVFDSPPSESKPARVENERKFILSSISVDEKEIYFSMIKELNGTVLTDPLFSTAATHLIMQTPIRSEKLLCSMSRGLWILHPSYIQASKDAGCFLPEEEFEWGNPKSAKNIPPLSSASANALAMAAYRWRQKVIADKKLAFTGMRALLYVSKQKVDPVNRLIKCGGGEILTEAVLSRVTHCFIENPGSVTFNWVKYAEHHIYCLNMLYLSDYLTANPLPNPVEKLIPEYVDYYNDYLNN